ncbi:hypothetical protein B7R22_15155 [Subtercola boreus]|uniref:GFO/IDH/MocA-like oxidoreductase domain-containing protein n=1 Tax=Subtercola boreus TaxID=120213 RepID=A0A3E0VSB4_9MICO|nr:hypothetical protein [Subtercola boreus]RFA12460.1 hypothetical protein B7R22_15155 [Subtercola boreus]
MRAITTAHHQRLDLSPTGRHGDPALAGGVLLDLGVYAFALAVDVLGTPRSVSAAGRVDAVGVDLGLQVLLGYPDAVATLSFSMEHPGPNDASIMGDEGWIHLDAPYFAWTPFRLHDASRPTRLVESREPYAASGMNVTRGMQFQALDLERAGAAGLTKSTMMPNAHTLAVLEAMDAARAQLG